MGQKRETDLLLTQLNPVKVREMAGCGGEGVRRLVSEDMVGRQKH